MNQNSGDEQTLSKIQGTIKAHQEKQNLLGGKLVCTDTFVRQDGAWNVVASQVTPLLKK